MSKQFNQSPSFNYDTHVKELNERFGRLVKQLKSDNKRGTVRHKFEVDFAYALHELKNCPTYLQGKRFDQASAIVSNLINHLKQNQEERA